MVTENSFLCNQRYLFMRPKCSPGRRASGFVLVAQRRSIVILRIPGEGERDSGVNVKSVPE
jgi:hypothetical protein